MNANLNGPLGYHVTDGNGNDVAFPATTAGYASQAACEAANAGETLIYAHRGGPIGMYLHDTNYADNTGGSPAPTFSVDLYVSPLTLTATPQIAGGIPSIALSWTGG